MPFSGFICDRSKVFQRSSIIDQAGFDHVHVHIQRTKLHAVTDYDLYTLARATELFG